MLKLRPMAPEEIVRFAMVVVDEYVRVRARQSVIPLEAERLERVEAARQLASLLGEGAKRETGDRLWSLVDAAGEGSRPPIGGAWLRVDVPRRWACLRAVVLFDEREGVKRMQEALAAVEEHLKALGIERIEVRVRELTETPRSLSRWMGLRLWEGILGREGFPPDDSRSMTGLS